MLNSHQLYEPANYVKETGLTFRRLTGPAQLIVCHGCLEERTAGSPPHHSASGRVLDVVYQDVSSASPAFYCQSCAARHAEGTDLTRSRSRFFNDTRGKSVNIT
jgi:hypothetical protein